MSYHCGCCCSTSACLAYHARSPLRSINFFVPWGTEVIPRVRYSRQNGSEQKEKWGQFGPTPVGVGIHLPPGGASDRLYHFLCACLRHPLLQVCDAIVESAEATTPRLVAITCGDLGDYLGDSSLVPPVPSVTWVPAPFLPLGAVGEQVSHTGYTATPTGP